MKRMMMGFGDQFLPHSQCLDYSRQEKWDRNMLVNGHPQWEKQQRMDVGVFGVFI
jgi:hypothetical protein